MRKVSASLLNGIKYNRNNKSKLEELIVGKEFKTTKEQQKGIDFEEDLAIMNGNLIKNKKIEDDEWLTNKKNIFNIIKGSEWQLKVEKVFNIDNEDFLIKGFCDFVKKDEIIYDIKTTKRYCEGDMKFVSSPQHLIYMELTGIEKFQYIINSWEDSKKFYIENYKKNKNNLDLIVQNIRFCRKILLENDLDFPNVE